MKRLVPILFLLLAACGRNDDHPWLGYVEGENAFIAAPQAGWLARVNVKRGDQENAGAALFTLDNPNQTASRDPGRSRDRARAKPARGGASQPRAGPERT